MMEATDIRYIHNLRIFKSGLISGAWEAEARECEFKLYQIIAFTV